MNNKSPYYLAAISAFVIWGFFSFALKAIDEYPAMEILFFRVLTASILTLILLLFIRRKKFIETKKIFAGLSYTEKRKTIVLSVLGGVLLSANWYFFIFSMNSISIKSAAYAYMVCPILTTFLAFFILGEKLKAHQWLAVGISAASCAVLAWNALRDLLFSLIIAASYAFYLISERKNNRIDKLAVLTVQMIIATLLMAPFYLGSTSVYPDASFFYLIIVIIAVVFTITPLMLNLYALKGIGSSVVGILLYINPVVNFIAAVVWFHEVTTVNQLISYSLAGISVVIFNKNFFLRKIRGV